MNIAARVPALSLLLLFGLLMSCRFERDANVADTIIRNGVIYDGSGAAPTRGDLAIVGDRIVAVGELKAWRSEQDVDADGLAVAPGFINILSWANDSLLVDGRGLSDLMQGVTLEVFGEGWSMGPLNPAMKQEMEAQGFANGTKISWTRLDEYLEGLVQRGVSVNVASFVGAATVRIHELGYEDRPPTEEELHRMRSLVAQAMQDGALGVGSSLIFVPQVTQ